jgi:hypothetical protein
VPLNNRKGIGKGKGKGNAGMDLLHLKPEDTAHYLPSTRYGNTIITLCYLRNPHGFFLSFFLFFSFLFFGGMMR